MPLSCKGIASDRGAAVRVLEMPNVQLIKRFRMVEILVTRYEALHRSCANMSAHWRPRGKDDEKAMN
jgi:hypothetical protein